MPTRACIACPRPPVAGAPGAAAVAVVPTGGVRPRSKGYGADHEALRRQVMARAGATVHGLGGRCESCGEPAVVGNPLEAAHIHARALGGQNRLDNYVALHRKENRGEGRGSLGFGRDREAPEGGGATIVSGEP